MDVCSSKIIDLEQEQDNSSQTVTPYSIVHVIQLKSELESSKKIINNLQLDVATLKGMIKNLRIRKKAKIQNNKIKIHIQEFKN